MTDLTIQGSWIGLISPRGFTEYNARFVIGRAAENLEHGRWYMNQELADIAGSALFLRDASQAIEKNIKKWRCDKTSEYQDNQ